MKAQQLTLLDGPKVENWVPPLLHVAVRRVIDAWDAFILRPPGKDADEMVELQEAMWEMGASYGTHRCPPCPTPGDCYCATSIRLSGEYSAGAKR